ncbi:hypothetical protein BC628DRAFT_865455 [Trametes gibbosa]|nr:hypothetical protein BC628DRAFT_865455 [Trametes gibbosa]
MQHGCLPPDARAFSNARDAGAAPEFAYLQETQSSFLARQRTEDSSSLKHCLHKSNRRDSCLAPYSARTAPGCTSQAPAPPLSRATGSEPRPVAFLGAVPALCRAEGSYFGSRGGNPFLHSFSSSLPGELFICPSRGSPFVLSSVSDDRFSSSLPVRFLITHHPIPITYLSFPPYTYVS